MASESRAATFVDYQNLYDYLRTRIPASDSVEEYIIQLLATLRQHLLGEEDTRTVLSRAYADFSGLSNNAYYIQKGLYMQGVEAQFVPVALHKNTIDLRFCIDVMETLARRSDIDTFVLLTGDHDYVPLVQTLLHNGRRVFMVSFREQASAELLRNTRDGAFIDAQSLLSETPAGDTPVPGYEPSAFNAVTDLPYGIDRDALEIIERYFGQYEEIYLTPLLRKLSEELGEIEGHEPKSLIGDLEMAGAVRLEKRRGVRYDYTVLILNAEHHEIIAIREELSGSPVHGDEVYEYDPSDDPQDLPDNGNNGYDDSDWTDADWDERELDDESRA